MIVAGLAAVGGCEPIYVRHTALNLSRVATRLRLDQNAALDRALRLITHFAEAEGLEPIEIEPAVRDQLLADFVKTLPGGQVLSIQVTATTVPKCVSVAICEAWASEPSAPTKRMEAKLRAFLSKEFGDEALDPEH